MRVVFFGSSQFSLAPLHALARSSAFKLVGVAAQPDRPSGRNRQVRMGLVHEAAKALGVPVMTPEKIGSPEAMHMLEVWQPDVIVVASFGQYIPTIVLTAPRYGVINIHPSLLPKYRGAAPLQWSIANGETVSGVTIFFVAKKMDSGNIILQEEHPIGSDENAEELSARYSEIGARMAVEALGLMASGQAPSLPQDDSLATFAPKISKDEGWIDWQKPAGEIHNRIRGFRPWPGNYFVHEGSVIKVWKSRVEEGHGVPGMIVDTGKDGPLIMTGSGAIRLLELQPEGKKSMSGNAFLCGHKWTAGGILKVTSKPGGKGVA